MFSHNLLQFRSWVFGISIYSTSFVFMYSQKWPLVSSLHCDNNLREVSIFPGTWFLCKALHMQLKIETRLLHSYLFPAVGVVVSVLARPALIVVGIFCSDFIH